MGTNYFLFECDRQWRAMGGNMDCPHGLENILQHSRNTVVSAGYGERVVRTPDYENSTCPPCSYCVIYVCCLPKVCIEENLYKIFSSCGPICEIRLMVDKNGWNRGYGFIRFGKPEDACKAIQKHNGKGIYDVNDWRFRIRVSHSLGSQLLISGVPLTITEANVRRKFEEELIGVVEVIVPRNRANPAMNRGYAFVKFDTYKHASEERRKIWQQAITLWNTVSMAEWAVPKMPNILNVEEHTILGLNCSKIPVNDGSINSPNGYFGGFPCEQTVFLS